MDDESFQLLHESTQRPLWGYIFNATRSAALADDLSQEAYLRMLTVKFQEPTTDAHLRHYLFRIAANLIADSRREALHSGEMRAVEPAIRSHEDAVLNRHQLQRAFSELRTKDRQLLWLALVEKFSHREIAQQLSVREPSIRPLLHGAKRRILRILKGGAE